MRETSLAAVVVVLVAAVAGVAVVGATAPGDGGLPALADTPETDDTVTRIGLSANGSAVWTVRYRTRLRTDADLAAYREFQATFRNDTAAYESSFRDRIAPVVADAAEGTGREMRLADVTATTSIQRVPRRWGVVAYRFRWANFSATAPDGSLRAGDVFGGGYYLGGNDTLVVTAPSDYRLTRVEPSPDGREDGRARWTGRRSFADGRPSVVAAPPTPTASPTATPSPTPSPTPPPTASPATTTTPATDQGSDDLVIPAAIAGVIAVLFTALVVAGRAPSWLPGGRGSDPTDPGDPDAPDGGASTAPTDTASTTTAAVDATDADGATADGDTARDETTGRATPDTGTTADGSETGTTDETTADETTTDVTTTDDTETESSDSTDATDTDATGDASDPTDATTAAGVAGDADGEPPEPYASVLADLRPPLTDEERVAQALAREHGRMRQSALADTLEWSASKTSRVLSRMADDDRVEKLRVGRENVVELVVDEDP